MVTLSMEPRKQIITLHKNYCLTSYSISCRHIVDSRNVATAGKPNVACVTTILNDRKYSEHLLHTHSLLIISVNTRTRYLLLYLLNKYVVNDLNGLVPYTLCTVLEYGSVVVRHKKTNYTHAIAYVIYST